MADNFLEKKYEDLRNGRQVIRKINASLDSLLSKSAESTQFESPDYKVKKAQLEAIIASASRLGLEFSAQAFEKDSSICLSCKDDFILGQLCLAMRLKACELKLQSLVKKKDTGSDDGAGAIISIFK